MTLRIPSGRWSGTCLAKGLATRAPQEAQRTKTSGLNSNPVAPPLSKHSLRFLPKTSKCHRKCFRVWLLWRHFSLLFVSSGSKAWVRWKYWSHVHSTTKYLVVVPRLLPKRTSKGVRVSLEIRTFLDPTSKAEKTMPPTTKRQQVGPEILEVFVMQTKIGA